MAQPLLDSAGELGARNLDSWGAVLHRTENMARWVWTYLWFRNTNAFGIGQH